MMYNPLRVARNAASTRSIGDVSGAVHVTKQQMELNSSRGIQRIQQLAVAHYDSSLASDHEWRMSTQYATRLAQSDI